MVVVPLSGFADLGAINTFSAMTTLAGGLIVGTSADFAGVTVSNLGATGVSFGSSGLDMNSQRIQNIGATGTDFSATGGLTLADALTVSANGISITGNSSISGTLNMNNSAISNIGAAGTDFSGSGGLTLADALVVSANGITVTGNSSISGTLNMNNNAISNIGAAGTDFSGTGGLTLADALIVSANGITVTGNSSISGTLNMNNNAISNIGAAGTDFTGSGGLTLADALTVSANGAAITGTCSATTFSGSGASLTSLSASNISSGSLALARITSSGGSDTNVLTLVGGVATWAAAPATGTSKMFTHQVDDFSSDTVNTEQDALQTSTGSRTFAANYFTSGMLFKFCCGGTYNSISGPQSPTVRIKIGSVTLISQALTLASSLSGNGAWNISGHVLFGASSATTAWRAFVLIQNTTTGSAIATIPLRNNGTNIDGTTTNDFQITVQWPVAASAGDSLVMTDGWGEVSV